MFRQYMRMTVLVAFAFLFGGCGPISTATLVPATDTSIPSAVRPAPADTLVPPTNTSIPPTTEPSPSPAATSAPPKALSITPTPVKPNSKTWIKTYGGDSNDVGMDVLPIKDGGYFIVGATRLQFEPEPQGDVYLIRTDAAGQVLWEKTYGGAQYDRGYAIIQAKDGGLVVAGGTKSFGAGEMDMYLIKLDQDGNPIWSKTFGGPQDEEAIAVYQTLDGGYILMGYTRIAGSEGDVEAAGNIGAGESNIFLVKTDGDGNQIWSHIYTGKDNAPVYTSAGLPVSDGGFLVLARINPNEDHDIFLLKVDANGRQVWSRAWNAEGKRGGNDIVPTSDGNYLIVGIYEGVNDAGDYLLMKVDPEGNEIWTKVLNNRNSNYALTATEAPEGGWVVTGFTGGTASGAGATIFRVSPNGQLMWTRDLSAYRLLHAYAILRHPEGGYILTGEAQVSEEISDVFLLKIDAEGDFSASSTQTPTSASTYSSAFEGPG